MLTQMRIYITFWQLCHDKTIAFQGKWDQMSRHNQMRRKKQLLLGMRTKPQQRDHRIYRDGYTYRQLAKFLISRVSMKDTGFISQLEKIHPEWLKEIESQKQRLLLTMQHRPKQRDQRIYRDGYTYRQLAHALRTCCRNKKFNTLIRKTHPEWFTNSTTRKRQLLFSLKTKPKYQDCHIYKDGVTYHQLAVTLRGVKRHDPKMYEQIRHKNPDWFKRPSDDKCRLLLQMTHRPRKNDRRIYKDGYTYHQLAVALHNYRKPSWKNFIKQIRQQKPQWFVKG